MTLRILYVVITFISLVSCKNDSKSVLSEKQPKVLWQPYDETYDLEATQKLEQSRMHLKLINSKVQNKNAIWSDLEQELDYFSEEIYNGIKPYVLEKSIPEIQQYIIDGNLTYEQLTLFFIYRIRKYESDNKFSLNGVIALNPNVVNEARKLDKVDKTTIDVYSVFGMPILLKDNINTSNMPTTAGAVILKENTPDNAFVTNKLLEHKALILGKANLSEWAYFFCSGCPVGYSAIGGQTLNPYGRMIFESGGSSSGSGVTVAANLCVAAVGTETSGSILSPSSQNSIVGLKPTIGVLSRTGIVPISSTLDTPGPMTKNVIDNSILFNALIGKDLSDKKSISAKILDISSIQGASLKQKRFGVIQEYLKDSLYQQAVTKIRNAGGEIIEIVPESTRLPGFLTILNIDMKNDLPKYFDNPTSSKLGVNTIQEIIRFNQKDSVVRMPYGQELFESILKDETTPQELNEIKLNLEKIARDYFDKHMDMHGLDAIVSVNNYHAGYAAVAKYPALTIPMGYTQLGEPKNLTLIGKPFTEEDLLQLGYAYEQISKERRAPEKYVN